MLKFSGILVLLLLSTFGMSQDHFERFMLAIRKHNYHEAALIHESNRAQFNSQQQTISSAFLSNAYNEVIESSTYIENFQHTYPNERTHLSFELYLLQLDNYAKCYRYRKAFEHINWLLGNYSKLISSKELKDLKSEQNLWKSLQNVSPQTVIKHSDSHIPITKDIAGLNRLYIKPTVGDSIDFIFDTGANMSVISASIAQQMDLTIISAGVPVGSSTGKNVKADLAICPEFKLGNITVKNAVFLVFPDKELNFPIIKYAIPGILGFPIMNALKEFHIHKSGTLFVPKLSVQKSEHTYAASNLALSGASPILFANDMYFTFDTGANTSMLYALYYQHNRADFDSAKIKKYHFAGVGGEKTRKGYSCNLQLTFGNQIAELVDLHVFTKELKAHEIGYGNLGQDLIQQFEVMVINFETMNLTFQP